MENINEPTFEEEKRIWKLGEGLILGDTPTTEFHKILDTELNEIVELRGEPKPIYLKKNLAKTLTYVSSHFILDTEYAAEKRNLDLSKIDVSRAFALGVAKAEILYQK